MLFDCVQECRDNGTLDNLNKWGLPTTYNYRRGGGPVAFQGRNVYDLGAKDIARLLDHLTGLDDDAAHGWPTPLDARGNGGQPTKEPEYIPVISFLDCFRPADDFACHWMDEHNDELLDIVEAKVEFLKNNPAKVGTVDPARMTLKRRGTKAAAETLAEGKPTLGQEDLVAAKHVLKPRGRPAKKKPAVTA